MNHVYRFVAVGTFLAFCVALILDIGETSPARTLTPTTALEVMGIIGVLMLLGYLAGRESK